MERKGKGKRRYVVFILIIFVILVATPVLVWYLNQSFIPNKIKNLITDNIEKNTNFSLKIDNIKFSIRKGFELSDINVFSKANPAVPILKAQKVWFRPFLIPSLKGIRIVLPAIHFQSVDIKIKRDEKGVWNFMPSQTGKPLSSFSRIGKSPLTILGISISDGAFTLKDSFQNKDTVETLTAINGKVGLSLPSSISMDLSANFYESRVRLRGKITQTQKSPKASLKISVYEFDLNNIKNIEATGIRGGLANMQATVYLEPDRTSTIKAKTDIKAFKFKDQNLYVDGDFSIDTRLQGDINTLKLSSYKGSVKFTDTTIGFSDALPAIDNATGEILFVDKSVTIKNLDAKFADAQVVISGKIDYTTEFPDLDINMSAHSIDLNKLIQNLPETIKDKLKNINIEKGKARININVSTKNKKSPALHYKGDLTISEASLTSPWLQDKIDNINCNVIFEKDSIAWDKALFNYAGTQYTSSGIATQLDAPLINGILQSDDFKAKGILKVKGDTVDINELDFTHKAYSLSVKGKLSNFKDPQANLEGAVKFKIEDIKPILTKYVKNIEKIDARGLVNASFIMQGPIKEPMLWDLFLKARSDNISYGKFSLGNAYLNLKIKDRFIDIPTLVFYPYGGSMNITSRINLRTKEGPYILNFDAKNIDLKKLMADTKNTRSKVKGVLSSQATLNGYSGIENSLKGNGWVQVKEGYLMEFPVVFDFFNAILGIPPEYIILTDAFGNFTVSDKRIYTSDFKMLSEKTALLWVGSLSFDGTMDFNITGRFAEDISTRTTSLGKIASAILHDAGAYIIEVKMTGTLDDPKYKVIPFPIQKIFNEKIVDTFKDMFGDIFD